MAPIDLELIGFAATQNVPREAVTHFVRVGLRHGRTVFAFGYWHQWGYCTGLVECDGGRTVVMTCTTDTGIAPLI